MNFLRHHLRQLPCSKEQGLHLRSITWTPSSSADSRNCLSGFTTEGWLTRRVEHAPRQNDGHVHYRRGCLVSPPETLC